MKENNDFISVIDVGTGVKFLFRNHKDKEKFFNAWDKYVVNRFTEEEEQ